MIEDECNTILEPLQNLESRVSNSTEEVEVFHIITEDYLTEKIETNWWDKAEFEQYLENERQYRKLVQQLNEKFFGETTWMAQIGYHITTENSNNETNLMDIDDTYLIDSPKWSDDELEFNNDYKTYNLG
ncbi:16162_t:CDS:2, partial [Racocetra persica]